MVVNSLNFLLFFIVVFVFYYLPISRKLPKFQNFWLFLASYFFYGFADWKMIPLLLGTTVVYYGVGLWLKSEMVKGNKKKASNITTLGVVFGVGILLYFKYLNFFADSFAHFLNAIGFNISWSTLNIVLPIGVSFFTFKLISYVIEVHREHIEPCKDFIEFGTYIAFFPTILSGPIDRPNKFIPQLVGVRNFNYDLSIDGCRQILWGMFTKMVIADNLATLTDTIWCTYSTESGSTLLVMALLYPVQMYADFDGYSNMAIGIGKLLGINVARNFNHPFLARNIAEYWRNWHISLTGWLTDYVFSPLNIAFRNLGNLGIILAIIINFLLIGLWHGSNWTFAIFGLYHGLLYIPLILSGAFGKKKKLKTGDWGLPKYKDLLKMIITFVLVSFGLIFFRAENIGMAFDYICSIMSLSILTSPDGKFDIICYFLPIIIIEWITRDWEYALQLTKSSHFKSRWVRWMLYSTIVMLIVLFSAPEQKFIYFQF